MATKLALSPMQAVELRDCWDHEALDFTPWLANNLTSLGEAVGMELELVGTEQSVGSFNADILCKNTGADEWVLVENQLDGTDHSHLGQLLTYAAGLHAKTIIWVTRQFREEHRAALDWLNENTVPEVRFFGLEIQLWRIGDSGPVAPRFNIVCQPNYYSKTVTAAKHETDSDALYLRYWQAFFDRLAQNTGGLKITKPSNQQWVYFSMGKSGFVVYAVASHQKKILRVEFSLDTGPNTKQQFQYLLGKKEQIETILGPLDWHEMPGKNSSKITLEKPVDVANESEWNAQHAWLIEQCKAFHNTFKSLLPQLTTISGQGNVLPAAVAEDIDEAGVPEAENEE